MSAEWSAVTVSDDGSHHVLDGRPIYEKRFTSVLKFHPPGLAPVIDDEGAYHIDVEGRAAYAHRYQQTFGFYEARASVAGDDGWTHIRQDGSPLYPERYAWCGNFQEGRCTVREVGGRYLHIHIDGRPTYSPRWRYAGDYRERCAVVMRDDGFSTHIDTSGRPVHDLWFLDLDVFHKGFARARDRDGWHHVDRLGRPAYRRRFASVEPFYNGSARVEDHSGRVLVIAESGETVIEIHDYRPSPSTPGAAARA